MGVGEKLKEAREKRGLTLEAVEEETKIRKAYLEALENENFGVLPPKVYAVGFLRRYAKTLGLNEEEMIGEFKALAYAGEENEEETFKEAKETVKSGLDVSKLPLRNILAGVIFLVLAIWLGNFLVGYFTNKIAQEKTPVSPPSAVEKEQAEKPKIKEQEKMEPVYTGVNLVIEARQNCWLNVKVDGNVVFSSILPAGESKSFKGQEEIYVKAGNAGGIDITFNGEKIGSLGEVGQVVDKTFTTKITNEG